MTNPHFWITSIIRAALIVDHDSTALHVHKSCDFINNNEKITGLLKFVFTFALISSCPVKMRRKIENKCLIGLCLRNANCTD